MRINNGSLSIVEELSDSHGSFHGTRALIGAMFRLAAQDYKFGDKEDVEIFIHSEWFEELCDGLNLNSTRVRELIIKGNVKHREEYQR